MQTGTTVLHYLQALLKTGTEWNRTEWNGTEQNRTERNIPEYTGTRRNDAGMKRNEQE